MPSDPAELLALAAKKNGLQNVGSEPLHIKATYQLLNDKGAVKETGTIDEIRVSDKKYKLTYTSPSFNQTDYSTDAGLFRKGDQNWASYPLFVAHNSLYPWFPTIDGASKAKLGTETMALGTAQLNCITLASDQGLFSYSGRYCFDQKAPVLRLVEEFHGASQNMYNSVASVGGVYVPEDTTYLEVGKPLVRIHLDSVNAVHKLDEDVFTHPQDAVKIPRRLVTAKTGPKLLDSFPPEIPSNSLADQGNIVIQAIINADGKVVGARALSGPAILTQAAVGSAQRSIFEPFRVDGEPAELFVEFDYSFHHNRP